MKIGDLVQWTEMEKRYHVACRTPGISGLTEVRKCGIIVDNNGINLFVRWENGDFRAQRPNTLEVISAKSYVW